MCHGGKRAGAGRKSDGQVREKYTVRVSAAERQAIKELLQRMRSGRSASVCQIDRQTLKAFYQPMVELMMFDMGKRENKKRRKSIDEKKPLALLMASMLGTDLAKDIAMLEQQVRESRGKMKELTLPHI